MLRHLGHAAPADRLEAAVRACLVAGETTADLGGTLGTRAAGDAVVHHLNAPA
jgi:3-isopropylmalate dehydrogenase